MVSFAMRYTSTVVSNRVFVRILPRSRTLHESVLKGHVAEFEQLLSVCVNPNTYEGGLTPLHIAVKKGRYKFITQLLLHGVDTEATDERGHTALVMFMILHVVRGSVLVLPSLDAHNAYRALSIASRLEQMERESRGTMGMSRVVDAEYTDISIVSPSGEVHLARVV